MDTPDSGASPAASPTAPDFLAFSAAADAADLGHAPDSGAPSDASPASEPAAQAAPDAGVKAPDKPAKNAKTRTEQLDTEITDLREKLRIRAALREELQQTAHPADDPPASEPAQPTRAEWQRYRQHPDAPKVEDFDAYEDFVAAQSVFVADQRFEERQRAHAADQRSRERLTETEQTISTFRERAQAARDADPEFDQKVDPGLMELVPAFALRPHEPVRPANVLMQECVKSDAAPALLLHFSTPEGQKDWQRIAAAATPAEMLKAFGRVEARFLSDGPPAAARAAASLVSSAPEPPTTLGRRPPASPDRAGAAIKAGDFGAYQAAADAADLAVRRR
jgi:hypothetical protein